MLWCFAGLATAGRRPATATTGSGAAPLPAASGAVPSLPHTAAGRLASAEVAAAVPAAAGPATAAATFPADRPFAAAARRGQRLLL